LDVSVTQNGNLSKLSMAPDENEFLGVFSNVKDATSNMVFSWDLANWQKKCSFPGDDAVYILNQKAIVVVTKKVGKSTHMIEIPALSSTCLMKKVMLPCSLSAQTASLSRSQPQKQNDPGPKPTRWKTKIPFRYRSANNY